MVKAPWSFIDNILCPEYEALSDALNDYLEEITSKIIKEEIYKDIDDIQEVEEMKRLTYKDRRNHAKKRRNRTSFA